MPSDVVGHHTRTVLSAAPICAGLDHVASEWRFVYNVTRLAGCHASVQHWRRRFVCLAAAAAAAAADKTILGDCQFAATDQDGVSACQRGAVTGCRQPPSSNRGRRRAISTGACRAVQCAYRVGQKVGHRLTTIILSNLSRFKFFHAGRFLGKFVVKWVLISHRTLHVLPHVYAEASSCNGMRLGWRAFSSNDGHSRRGRDRVGRHWLPWVPAWSRISVRFQHAARQSAMHQNKKKITDWHWQCER